MARPRLKIDPEQVRQLALIQCTESEMAAVLYCSVDTLHRRFADIIKQGQEQGKSSLRRAQYKLAIGGNATMLIWLGKQLLGQRDLRETEIVNSNEKPVINVSVVSQEAAQALQEMQAGTVSQNQVQGQAG